MRVFNTNSSSQSSSSMLIWICANVLFCVIRAAVIDDKKSSDPAISSDDDATNEGTSNNLLRSVYSSTTDENDEKNLQCIIEEMRNIYTNHKINFDGKNYSRYPMEMKMEKSINADERFKIWTNWYQGVGRAIRPKYIEYVKLKNRLARKQNLNDYGDEWQKKYYNTSDKLRHVVLKFYTELEPLYKQLHAYVRRKLYTHYGAEVINLQGPLPAHLLGDMWGRFWTGLYDIVRPYQSNGLDPTHKMIEKNYTIRKMIEMGDEFFKSMGLKPLPNTFYNLSKFEQQTDSTVECHPQAFSSANWTAFYITMCLETNLEHFLRVHHELGHIQYYMQYAHLPDEFRGYGPNGAFHEAIGELISMNVATPKHLHKIGLLDSYKDDDETNINFLMQQALRTVSTLPFHLVEDLWRWEVFAGQVPKENWNQVYWELKFKYVGVAPNVSRNGSLDLDPVALLHVSYDVDMIRYFIRTIIQYQFNEALCKKAGHTGPLYKCDFYNSKEAGTALGDMMKLGKSKPWPEAMEVLTGHQEMSTKPLLDYFKPLQEWLEKENKEKNEFIGWK